MGWRADSDALKASPPPSLKTTSVHIEKFIDAAQLREGLAPAQLAKLAAWPRLIEIRNEVLKVLEVARQSKFIGTALEARVVLAAEGDTGSLLQQYRTMLPTLFIVSQVELSHPPLWEGRETSVPGLQVKVEKAAGKKCERCWNYSERVGEDSRYPQVCERCVAALGEIEAMA